jgi:hypothetical protein
MANIVRVPRELINFFRSSRDYAGIQRYFQDLDSVVGGTTTSINDLAITISGLRGKLVEALKEIDELKQQDSQRAKFKELQDQIDDLQQQQRGS